MKIQLRKLFWFILQFFEKGSESYTYKPLNRKILLIVGFLFIVLSMITLYLSLGANDYGYLLPVIVFFSVGFISMIVGFIGSDRAVSKIWGNN